MWIKINDQNQVIAFNTNQQPGFIEVEAPTDFEDFFTFWKCYKYENGELVRDNNAIIQQQEQIEERAELAELQERLALTNDQVLEALEALFSATTITGIVAALVDSGKSLKSVLQERQQIRQRIKEIGG